MSNDEWEPMPKQLLQMIKVQKTEHVAQLRRDAAAIESMTAKKYASEYAISVGPRTPIYLKRLVGDEVPETTLQIDDCKGPGWWTLRTPRYESNINHDEVLTAFEEKNSE